MLGFARLFTAQAAEGSLIRSAEGTVIGSRLVAQNYVSDRCLRPRPSGADYDGQGASGSNLSPTNPAIKARAAEIIAREGATPERPFRSIHLHKRLGIQ